MHLVSVVCDSQAGNQQNGVHSNLSSVDARGVTADGQATAALPLAAKRFDACGVRRGRAADQRQGISSIHGASAVIITEEGWGNCFYYPFESALAAWPVFHAWRHTARILYDFDAAKGVLTREVQVHGGATLGLSIVSIRAKTQPLMLD